MLYYCNKQSFYIYTHDDNIPYTAYTTSITITDSHVIEKRKNHRNGYNIKTRAVCYGDISDRIDNLEQKKGTCNNNSNNK